MAKLLTECVGTFFLVLTIGLTVLDGTPLAPLAIGSALMALVYMGGHISGAHYNPAASLAILMRGRMESKELIPYWVAQITGAILASLVVYASVGSTFAPAPASDASVMAALLLEFLFTFGLCLVILNAATARGTEGNSYYGLAIGFTVLAGMVAAGPVSGGAFNPAVGIGTIVIDTVMGGGSFESLWLYLVGPFAGGVVAAAVFKMQNPEDV